MRVTITVFYLDKTLKNNILYALLSATCVRPTFIFSMTILLRIKLI